VPPPPANSLPKRLLQKLKSLLNKEAPALGFPNGHYYSPVVNVAEVIENSASIWAGVAKDGVIGIDLNHSKQLELVKQFENYYAEIPFSANKTDGFRYYFENVFYSYCDGINLYSVMRHFKPNNIIEVGSGYTSALMLDVNNKFFDNKIKLSFIEPYTERLDSLLTDADQKNTEILRKPVQKIAPEYFDKLGANDILFIDSTHVSKTGSDVNYLFFEILPRLASGVIVHVHDVYYPFEYPEEMINRGIFWNEDYLLRAFLTNNNQFEILLFADYLHKHHSAVYKNMPLVYKNSGANIWLRKI
jgi:hypothetical protein